MKFNSALTLFEVLVVIALIGIVSLPLYISYTKSQANQSLRSSSEQLAHAIQNAHVFAREAKDKRAWGVKSLDTKTFAIVSGKPQAPKAEKVTSLEALVQFSGDFEIWFEIGTGYTDAEKTITLVNSNNLTKQVIVHKTGVVDLIE